MGWDVQVRKDESQQEQFDARVSDASHGVGDQLGIDDETAAKLFRAGGATIELVLQIARFSEARIGFYQISRNSIQLCLITFTRRDILR